MEQKEKELREYVELVLGKCIHYFYMKEDAFFGPSYFVNDAYVVKDYIKEDALMLSIDRLKSVHEIIAPLKISEKLLGIDEHKKVKITKVLHGDLSYEEEPHFTQIHNLAKVLKKLHKNVSENDIPMDLVSLFYEFKNGSENHLPKVYENRIVRELKEIKDKTPIGLCHNHLTKDNIVYRFDSAFLINFELANINYTYFDLASFINENNLSQENKNEFLKTYFGASYNSLKERRIEVFLRFLQGFYYYYYQYLFSITNKEIYQKLAEKELKKING